MKNCFGEKCYNQKKIIKKCSKLKKNHPTIFTNNTDSSDITKSSMKFHEGLLQTVWKSDDSLLRPVLTPWNPGQEYLLGGF